MRANQIVVFVIFVIAGAASVFFATLVAGFIPKLCFGSHAAE